MAFLVYLFVLLVAAGSIVFGLDLTQSPLQPPSYATATSDTRPGNAPATVRTAKSTVPVSAKTTPAPVAAKVESEPGAAARAQATAEETPARAPATTAAVTAPNSCAIESCAAAYRSFRASDCTYQSFGGERRLCTKSASSKGIAAARTPVHRTSRAGGVRRAYDRRYAERDSYRDSYAEPRRGGWASDLFGR